MYMRAQIQARAYVHAPRTEQIETYNGGTEWGRGSESLPIVADLVDLLEGKSDNDARTTGEEAP